MEAQCLKQIISPNKRVEEYRKDKFKEKLARKEFAGNAKKIYDYRNYLNKSNQLI